MPDIRICTDAQDLATQFAAMLAESIAATIERTGRCTLALSGGNTPRRVHHLLASTYRDRIPWPGVHVFWGDERFVPADDPHSNYRMARETLLDHVPCPAGNIHPMPTGGIAPSEGALAYEQTLRRAFTGAWPRFDVLLLGLGVDGHTASLFPGSPALDERERWVVAATAPIDPRMRLTMTVPALTAAERIHVLVSGADKVEALGRVLDERADPRVYPAATLRAAGDRVRWWVDRAAAAGLTPPS